MRTSKTLETENRAMNSSLVRATCKCGYTKDAKLGIFHDSDGRQICFLPSICDDCRSVVAPNYLKRLVSCPQCSSYKIRKYNHRDLSIKDVPPIVAEWRHFTLHSGTYRCPQCQQFQLRWKTIITTRGGTNDRKTEQPRTIRA